MLPSLPRRVLLSALVLVVALSAAACGSTSAAPVGTPVATPAPIDPTPVEPSPATQAGDPIVVDLSPGGAPVELGNGWTVQHCEGDAPFLCVRDEAGIVLGTIEFGSYPPSDAIAQALSEGNVADALARMVRDQHDAIEADRHRGCGDTYEYRGEPVRHTTVGDRPAAVYAFSGVVHGREIERHRSYYTVHAGQVWVVNAAASDPEGCMASDLGEFLPGDLASFEPYFDRIMAGSELPQAGRAITEGAVVGVNGGLDGGLVYLLAGGGRIRVAQPAPMTEVDVQDLGLVRRPAVAQLVVVDGDAGSRFAVVPPDGPDARLQLIVDGTIREVVVQHVDPALLDGIPDVDAALLGQVRPAGSTAG